jgi:hypothetical protein
MPFHGVLPHRQMLFKPEPKADIGVNDRYAWQFNPTHRHLYNKLQVALWQDLLAAPCGTNPVDFGLKASDKVFVKPIMNLAGMSLGAKACLVKDVPVTAGYFWCEYLTGQQSSTDCLVLNGEVVWFAHTLASIEKNKHRPVYWQVGMELPLAEEQITAFIRSHMPTYTGICNMEMIADKIIEVHLRGSNAFFDFYGDSFMFAWTDLVDHKQWDTLASVKKGIVYSIFGITPLPANTQAMAKAYGVRLQIDEYASDRMAICYADKLQKIKAFLHYIQACS